MNQQFGYSLIAATALFAWASACEQSAAATVALRQQAYASGAVVLLSDLADISAEDDFERDALISAPLMPAPAKGSPVYFTQDDIRRRLIASGVGQRSIRFTGARRVAIHAPRSRPDQGRLAGQKEGEPSIDSVRTAVIEAIRDDLADRSGFDRWQIELNGQETGLAEIGLSDGPLVVRGPAPPRPGRLNYRVSAMGSSKEVQIYVRAERTYEVLVAVRQIRQGDVVRAS